MDVRKDRRDEKQKQKAEIKTAEERKFILDSG